MQKSMFQFYQISFLHPDSKKESGEVLRKLKNRGGHEINLFYETDFSVVTAFKKVVPEESEEELNAIATEKNWLVLLLKYLINRPRPYQFCNEIKENMLTSKTGDTPAYPSGHSFQAFYLAKKLSEKHPALQQNYIKQQKIVEMHELLLEFIIQVILNSLGGWFLICKKTNLHKLLK